MRQVLSATLALLSAVWIAPGPAAAQVEVSEAVHYDVSPPLSELAAAAQASSAAQLGAKPGTRIIPLNTRQTTAITPAEDTALQAEATIPQQATLGLAFQGIGVGLGSFEPAATPPDTTGAAGATQFVQWVNTSFAVFDKSTGKLLMGPVAGNTLFAGFGGACQTENDGDPIVQYDKVAGRWVLSQFTDSAPYFECVAVSTTADATGTYNRYAFSMGPNFADYPHVGVWPDGYYFSFNMFGAKGSIGGRACAFDRTAMLAGRTAQQECFDSADTFGMVPSDWDGETAPPNGAPNVFVQFAESGSALNLYKLHADFTTPANATFSPAIPVAVAAFAPACQEEEPSPLGDPDTSGSGCIPQKGVKQKLDELSDRMMYRAAYRNFGDHEALVATHTIARVVKGKGKKLKTQGAAIRWYELRGVSTTPVVFQQGTFAPNHERRWMPSIGMDNAGDIAVGYNGSGPNVHPEILFTGRTSDDPAGQMEIEKAILQPKGSQKRTQRWGDYSALSIDPGDDCTFWYTTEYLNQTGGDGNWSTWIASFKYPDCE